MSVAASGAGGRRAPHVLMLFSECLETLHYTRVNAANRRNIFGESEPSLVVVVGHCAFYTGTLFFDLWPCLWRWRLPRARGPTHPRTNAARLGRHSYTFPTHKYAPLTASSSSMAEPNWSTSGPLIS